MTTLAQARTAYIAEMANKGFTDQSRTTYRRILEAFERGLPADITTVQDVTLDHCRAHIASHVERGNAKATIAHQATVLRVFFEFCEDEDWVDRSPAKKIKRPKVPKSEDREVTTITSEEAERLLDSCKTWPEKVCLNLLLCTGVRRGAASACRWRDVDLTNGWIRFYEKGGKVISKPIADQFREVLERGIELGKLDPSPDNWVVPYRQPEKGKDPSEERSGRCIYHIVKAVAKRAGVTAHVHSNRAAFAVKFLEENPGQIESLQRLMGHSDIATTSIYLRRFDKEKAMSRVVSMRWGAAPEPREEETATAPAEDAAAPLPSPGLVAEPIVAPAPDPEPIRAVAATRHEHTIVVPVHRAGQCPDCGGRGSDLYESMCDRCGGNGHIG